MTAKVTRIASGGLRITALEVRNLWGVKEAVIRPGQRTILKGANGTGKTAVLSAIQLALEGGTLSKYQRVGASPEEQPEIILEISGPKDFIRVERVGDKPPVVLRRVGDSEALERVPAPATFLKGLFDVKGANPFAFLQASGDDRAQLLLEALDIRMDEGALAELLGEDAPLAGEVPGNLHALVRLALIYAAVYSARRGCNVDADGKLKAAEQLKRSVPHERAQDATEEIAGLEARVVADAAGLARSEEANDAALARATDDAHHDAAREEGELTRKAGAKILAAKVEHDRWAAELRAETEKQISDRERALNLDLNAESALLRESVGLVAKACGEKIAVASGLREKLRELEASSREALTKNRERLAGFRAQQAEFVRHENTREQIAKFEEAAKRHEADADRLSKKLRGLEDLKRQLAGNLPIEGLDISGKEIHVNGVPWRDLNKAQQGAIAGLVAAERAKKCRLPVVLFDEAEQFDAAHIAAIGQLVEAAGAQFFAAAVTEGELTIEADGEPAGTVRVDAPADPIVSR